MIKTIITDNNPKTVNLLSSYLKNIDNIELCGVFDSLNSCENFSDLDLVIFDINLDNSDNILRKVKDLKNKHKKLSFIAISYEINSELVAKTLKYDISDFLLKPILPEILRNSITKILNMKNNIKQKYANTICVFSNKGGCGKTSIAVNLAFEMAKKLKLQNAIEDKDDKVCLLDLSFNSEDIVTYLNIKPKNKMSDIVAKLENADDKMALLLADQYKDTNLYVFSLSEVLDFEKKYDIKTVLKIINSLKNIFSYIIIDTTNAINEMNAAILDNSDLVLLIALENIASIRNCQKCYEFFGNISSNKEKYKLVVNRHIENSQITIKDMEQTLQNTVFYKIPNNYLTLIDAINSGQTLEEANPQSNIAKAYKNFAQEILNIDFTTLINADSKTPHHGIFNMLRRMGE